ncbi:MAG: DNA polymerase II large subunit, partial [Candidatus Saliniplasma sp.]
IGLAVLTEGILVAPLEGIGGVEIRENFEGSNYVELSFAGPIRSAGGTGQAMSVLIADVVRRELGIGEFKATQDEIQRFKEEIPLYKKSLGLQYTPSNKEISLIIDGCPVSISGEGTDTEVSGNRDLPRVDTNRVRGGACLVIAEGMCLKAQKLKKHVDKLGIGWDFLDEYIDKYMSGKSKSDDEEEEEDKGIKPNYKYIKETIAGRPVFGHPSRKGGFRLRYGRARTGGLASIAINPATMYLTDEFMALGTQVKIERPGKAGAVTPCDMIEGPTVLLHDGTVKRVDTAEEAKDISLKVKELIDIGEILIPYGEFVENNHPLVPGAYCHEWWIQEVDEDIKQEDIDDKKAIRLSKDKRYPLHPKYTYFWDYVEVEDIEELRAWISEEADLKDNLHIKNKDNIKETMEQIGIPHTLENEKIIVEDYRSLLFTLGLDLKSLEKIKESDKRDPIEYISDLAGITIRSKGPTTIGSRMARPEKAKERKMSPPVHTLFPVGDAGGSQRLIRKAVDVGVIEVDVSARRCNECGRTSATVRCSCDGRCEIIDEPKEQKIPMKNIFRQALSTLGEGGNVQKIKGVKGLMTKTKTPEALEKGILRAKYGIYVFKDGTTRYDMTDLPVTHFKPKEIGLSVEKAKELGYRKDIHGNELKNEDQMLELKVQDFIASNSAGKYIVKVAKFVDDLLEKYYGLDSYYNAERKEDMIGELIVGLAPHTSGGVLGRLIGFHKGRAGYAHPYFHAAKRRNCDGDEDCIMLLLDGLLNFSEEFLPQKRGGLMDAPLVLTTRIDPSEIDSEAHNVDTLWKYPLEFYERSMDYPDPKELSDVMEIAEDRLETESQYEGFGYTHDTDDIAEGPTMSKYTRLGKMTDKMNAQIKVADLIRAVDTADVVSRVISDHFIPDLIGNFNKFGVQTIRCTKCNTKYRRIPL